MLQWGIIEERMMMIINKSEENKSMQKIGVVALLFHFETEITLSVFQ